MERSNQFNEITLVFRRGLPTEQAIIGNTYRAHGRFEDVGNGTSVYVQLKTNGSRAFITSINVAPSDELITVRLLEEPTVTDGDNEITAYNTDLSNLNTAETLVYDNPTSISGGTELESVFLPGSSGLGGERNGQRYNSRVDWVTKESTDYVFEIMNDGTGNVDVGWDISWYEMEE
jgi:hypothetical protein